MNRKSLLYFQTSVCSQPVSYRVVEGHWGGGNIWDRPLLEADTSTKLNERKTKEPNCLILLFYATNEGNFKFKLPLNYKPVNQRPLGGGGKLHNGVSSIGCGWQEICLMLGPWTFCLEVECWKSKSCTRAHNSFIESKIFSNEKCNDIFIKMLPLNFRWAIYVAKYKSGV